MSSKLIEALRHHGPITPQLRGPSEYQRNEQMVSIATLAAHGSMTNLYRLQRMSEDNKRRAWVYLPADAKHRLKWILDAQVG